MSSLTAHSRNSGEYGFDDFCYSITGNPLRALPSSKAGAVQVESSVGTREG